MGVIDGGKSKGVKTLKALLPGARTCCARSATNSNGYEIPRATGEYVNDPLISLPPLSIRLPFYPNPQSLHVSKDVGGGQKTHQGSFTDHRYAAELLFSFIK